MAKIGALRSALRNSFVSHAFCRASNPHLTPDRKPRYNISYQRSGGSPMKTGIDTIWEDRKRILGMPISFTKYYLSEDRLFVQTGLLSMKIEETLLYRVTDLCARRTVPAYLRCRHDRRPLVRQEHAPHCARKCQRAACRQGAHSQARRADEGLAQHPRQRISRRRSLRARPVRPYGA